MANCTCVECHVCRGMGSLWFSLGSNVGTPHRNDDLGDSEQCENCRGYGVEEVCESCQYDEWKEICEHGATP